MKYMVQSNHGYHQDFEPPPIDQWHTISSDRAGHQEFDHLETAINEFTINSNLARCIWPMRIIDSDGIVYRKYDPEMDTRLPGCRWRLIQRNAYFLWVNAGCPESDGREFWEQAENGLQESCGVFILKEGPTVALPGNTGSVG